jgi:hypothetical protein
MFCNWVRQAKLGRGGGEVFKLKPCVGAQGVNSLPRQSWSAAGTESCVVRGQPRLRSVDREHAGRAIEPRNKTNCGSRRRPISGRQYHGVVTTLHHGSTGVEERGMFELGFPSNLGDPISSTDRSVVGEATTRNNPGLAARGVDPAGSEQQAHGWYFVAMAMELREKGDGKSERSIVALKRG